MIWRAVAFALVGLASGFVFIPALGAVIWSLTL